MSISIEVPGKGAELVRVFRDFDISLAWLDGRTVKWRTGAVHVVDGWAGADIVRRLSQSAVKSDGEGN